MRINFFLFGILTIQSCVPVYEVNNYSKGFIDYSDDYRAHIECFEGLDSLTIEEFIVSDSLLSTVYDIRYDVRSSKFIKLEDPLVIYGCSREYTWVYSVYSPETFGNNSYYLDMNDLDSNKYRIIKERYKSEYLESISRLCE